MTRARIFKSGNSQAVRIPKQLQFEEKEVEITRHGDELILRPVKPKNIVRAIEILRSLPDDFVIERDGPPQKRERL